MIYYTYKITYTNVNGQSCTVSQTSACEDIDYPTSLEETKLITQQQAWAMNDFILVTSFTETVTTITVEQYNAIVFNSTMVEPIPDWDPNEPLN